MLLVSYNAELSNSMYSLNQPQNHGWLSSAASNPASLTPHPAHKHFICKIFAYPYNRGLKKI